MLDFHGPLSYVAFTVTKNMKENGVTHLGKLGQDRPIAMRQIAGPEDDVLKKYCHKSCPMQEHRIVI